MTGSPSSFLALSLALCLAACGGDPLPRCQSLGKAHAICGLHNPEDLALIPESASQAVTGNAHRFLIVSELGSFDEEAPGELSLLDVTTEQVTPLFPQSGIGTEPLISEGPDLGDPRCPGPPDKRVNPHGIDLAQRSDGRLVLYVVNHGGREAVELFELTSEAGMLALAWRGCVPMPESIYLDDVAALPGGGFAATHVFPKSLGLAQLIQTARGVLGIDTGYVVTWSPGGTVTKLKGTESPFPNGIASSANGSELFVSIYLANEVRRYSRSTGQVLGSVAVQHPDNITWSDDGRLLVASHVAGLAAMGACGRIQQGACPAAFEIVAIDPHSLRKTRLLKREGAPMGAATVALPLGRELFLGSFKSDRMLRLPR